MSLDEMKSQVILWKKMANSGIAIHHLHNCLELIELEEQKILERIEELEKEWSEYNDTYSRKLIHERIVVLRGVIGK